MFKNRLFEPFPTPHPFCLIFLLTLQSQVIHLPHIVSFRIKDMPTNKPRLNLSLDTDMNELIAELAALQGIPKATLVVQYLDMLRPHMVEIRDAIRMVNDKKDPSPQLRKMLLDGQQELFNVIREEFTDD